MHILLTTNLAILLSLVSLTVHASDILEIEIEVVTPLSFGLVAAGVSGQGAVRLEPETGRVTALRGSQTLGGRPTAMYIRLKGSPHCRFDIITPAKITLNGNSVISEIKSTGDIEFDASGEASIRLGGLLTLNAQPKAGTQRGSTLINVEYQTKKLQNRRCQL